jgi:hypothetical protein
LVDGKSRRVVEEAETARDLQCVEVGLGIEGEFVAEPHHRRQYDELVENSADLRAIVDRNPRRGHSTLDLG